jgi:hypothetical protein
MVGQSRGQVEADRLPTHTVPPFPRPDEAGGAVKAAQAQGEGTASPAGGFGVQP